MRGTTPSSALTLCAEILQFFQNTFHPNSTAIVFQQSFLKNYDKKANLSVKSVDGGRGSGLIYGVISIRFTFCRCPLFSTQKLVYFLVWFLTVFQIASRSPLPFTPCKNFPWETFLPKENQNARISPNNKYNLWTMGKLRSLQPIPHGWWGGTSSQKA